MGRGLIEESSQKKKMEVDTGRAGERAKEKLNSIFAFGRGSEGVLPSLSCFIKRRLDYTTSEKARRMRRNKRSRPLGFIRREMKSWSVWFRVMGKKLLLGARMGVSKVSG